MGELLQYEDLFLTHCSDFLTLLSLAIQPLNLQ